MNNKLQLYQKLYNQEIGKRNSLQERKDNNIKKIKELELRIDKIEKAQLFLQLAAKEIQDNIRYHIEDIVQLAIDACFPNKYKFKLEFGLKRNKTEANLNFYEKGRIIDPIASSGGGLVNISCFAIRISAWSLNRTEPIILLDEPFSKLSPDLQPKAGEIIKELSEKLGFQIILITHNRETMIETADKVFEVKMKKYEEWEESIVLIKKG